MIPEVLGTKDVRPDVRSSSEQEQGAVMETIGTSHPSFWIHENLLEQQPLHQRNFPQTPSRIASLGPESTIPSEPVSLGRNEFVSGVQAELPRASQQYIAPPMGTPECRSRDAREDHSHLPPARKLQKAGRERLRRDQLNEQFAKLADVLDPVRPRNDKGSILAESILAVTELRAEIARMKSEHIALSDESRDLSVEKSELQEEKSLLETETGRLQDQLNQSVDNNQSAQLPGFHPGLMTNSQFSYPLMIKASLSSKDIISQDSIPDQTHQMPVSPFFSVAPFLHPAYQTYGMLGSRQSPYSHFSHPGQHIHVGRPAARYPVPIHPTPIYPSKIAQAKALDPPTIVTDLQLQTPSSKTQHSVSDQDQCENTTSTMGRVLDDLEDSGMAGSKVASADEQLSSQPSLSSNSIGTMK